MDKPDIDQSADKIHGSKEQITTLMTSFCKVQAELKAIPKSGENKYLGYKYSNLDDVLDALRPLTAENNLAVMQFPEDPHTIVTYVYHTEGGYIESRTCCDTSNTPPELDNNRKPKQKNLHQDFGKGITYLKRYALCAIFGISSGDIDDDAHGMEQKQQPNKEWEYQANFNEYAKRIKNPSKPVTAEEMRRVIDNESDLTRNQKNRLYKMVDEKHSA